MKSKVKKSNMDIELDNLVMAPALRSFQNSIEFRTFHLQQARRETENFGFSQTFMNERNQKISFENTPQSVRMQGSNGFKLGLPKKDQGLCIELGIQNVRVSTEDFAEVPEREAKSSGENPKWSKGAVIAI